MNIYHFSEELIILAIKTTKKSAFFTFLTVKQPQKVLFFMFLNSSAVGKSSIFSSET